MGKITSVEILDPLASTYKSIFVVEAKFVYGDLDHYRNEEITCDKEEIVPFLNALLSVPDDTREIEQWQRGVCDRVDEWWDENKDKNWKDMPIELRMENYTNNMWPGHEGIPYWLRRHNVYWYDENGIKYNVELKRGEDNE